MSSNRTMTLSDKLKVYLKSSPGKLTLILILCILCTSLMGMVYYYNYSDTKHAVQTVGKDTVPSIVAAENIYAALADANANAMNGLLTKQNDQGMFWKTYRNEMNQVHEALIAAARNITYGDEEYKPILAMMTKLGEYENGIGVVKATINSASVNDFLFVNKIMREEILPAASNLDKANFSHLDAIYHAHQDSIVLNSFIFLVFTILLIAVLIGSQVYIFRKTHRIFNIGLVLATLVFVVFAIYAATTLSITESKLKVAKQDAFDSIHALWKARAVAYDGNADESLFLLFHGDKASQDKSTADYTAKTALLTDIDPQAALTTKRFGGFLGNELGNITFEGEADAATRALKEWAAYIKMDGQIRTLENQGKHNEAIAFCIGNNAGESNWQFARFDKALGDTLDINQKQFDSSIQTTFDTIYLFPIALSVTIVLIVALSFFGIKQRLNEFRF